MQKPIIMLKNLFRTSSLFVFVLALSLSTSLCHSQEKIFTDSYIKKNILDREFSNYSYLDSTGDTDYFFAEEPKGQRIIAIHNVSKSTPVLSVKKSSHTYSVGHTEEVALYTDYDKENAFYRKLAQKVKVLEPSFYSNSKYISVYHYVKDFIFGYHPEHFYKCDIPICKTGIKRDRLTDDTEWNLVEHVRFIYDKLTSDMALTVNDALSKGRKVYYGKEAPVASWEIGNGVKNGFIYHDGEFWRNSWVWIYPDRGIFSATSNKVAIDTRLRVLEPIFEGDFKDIERSGLIPEYIISFLFKYAEFCEDKIVLYKNFSLTQKISEQSNLGSMRLKKIIDMGSLKVDIKFADYFSDNYSNYDYSDLSLNDMEAFIKKLGCDCKEVNQLMDNLYQLSQNLESIQSLNKPSNGDECYFE